MLDWLNNATVIAKVLIVVAIPTSLLLLHVWNQYRITELGYEIAEVTSEHRQLLEKNKKLTVEARIQGHSERVSEVAQKQFGLQQAHPNQVIIINPDIVDERREHARLDEIDETSTSAAIQ